MATSDVEICNLALTRIGHKTITSLTGGSSAERAETLDAASVGQIAVAIGQFVQAAYAAEAAVLAAIAAGTITTTAQIDAATWPSNS